MKVEIKTKKGWERNHIKYLENKYGDNFLEYSSTTKKLIPWIYWEYKLWSRVLVKLEWSNIRS